MSGELVIRRAIEDDANVLVNFNRAMAMETEGKDLEEAIVTAGVCGLLGNPALGLALTF